MGRRKTVFTIVSIIILFGLFFSLLAISSVGKSIDIPPIININCGSNPPDYYISEYHVYPNGSGYVAEYSNNTFKQYDTDFSRLVNSLIPAIIYLGEGDYWLNSVVIMKNNTRISGVSWETVVHINSSDIQFGFRNDMLDLNYPYTYNITLENFAIDGSMLNVSIPDSVCNKTAAVDWFGVVDGNIKQLLINNSACRGINLDISGQCTIKDCLIMNTRRSLTNQYLGHAADIGYCHMCSVINNEFVDCAASGMDLAASAHCTVANNKISTSNASVYLDNTTRGILIESDYLFTSKNNTVTENNVFGYYYGIFVTINNTNITLSNNIFVNSTIGIYIVAKLVTCENNTVSNCSSYGIAVQWWAFYNIVNANLISNCSSYGIIESIGSNFNSFTSNICKTTGGINITGPNSVNQNNTVV